MVEQPDYDRSQALRRQRRMLEAQADHLLPLIDTVDRALQAERNGATMSIEDAVGVFGDFDPMKYEDEAGERWGESEAYEQSAARTAHYTTQGRERIKAEVDEIYQRFLDLMAAGTARCRCRQGRRRGASGAHHPLVP